MKLKLRNTFAMLLTVIAVIAVTLTACGGGGGDPANPTSSTTTTSATGSVNVDIQPAVAHYASPEAKLATAAVASGSECFSATMQAVSNGAWWVSGSFNIVNSCPTAQALSGTQILIASPGATLNPTLFQINTTTPWLSSEFATITGSGSAILLTVNSVSSPANNLPYSVAANGGSINVSFGYNPNGTQLSGITATINGTTPVVPATLSVEVNSTGLASYCTAFAPCNIPVVLTGQGGQYNQTLTTIVSVTGDTTYNLIDLMPGTYTLTTGTLPSGVVATYSASTVTLTSGQAGPTLVLTLTKAPDTTGILNFTLTNPNPGLFTETSLPVTLQATDGASTSIQAVFGQPVSSTLTAGSYTISADIGLASASQGVYEKLQPVSSTVTVAHTTTINPVWISTTALITQPISITGLNAGDSATLVFTDNSYTFNQEVVTATAAGQTINAVYKFPVGDTVTVNLTTNSSYASVAPFTITIPSSGTASPITVALSAKTQPVNPAFVFSAYKDVGTSMNWYDPNGVNTYVMSTTVKSNNTGALVPLVNALPTGMNTVTWAFATGDCTNENWAGMTPSQFAAPNVNAFKNANVNYILSTGGAAGAFTCSSGESLQAFIGRYASANLIGIDFDIEGNRLSNQQIINLVNAVAWVKANGAYPNLRVSFTLSSLAATQNAGGLGSSINSEGEQVMAAIQASGLTDFYINLMAMDYGDPPSSGVCVVANGACDMGQSAIQAVKNFLAEFSGTSGKMLIKPSQIEITALIGVNDITDEIFTASNAAAVAQYVKSSGLGGLHYWSFDRDAPNCSTGNVQTTCSGVSGNALQFATSFLTALNP